MRNSNSVIRSRAAAAAALIIIGSAVLAWSSALAQPAEEAAVDEAAVQALAAVRTDNHPTIDGVLGDACWQRAPRMTNFVQHEPEDGKAVSESTAVQVAYSDEGVYVAMEMYDSHPGQIVNRLTRRDREQEADCAYVILDSYHDHQTAYGFRVYASGTQQDVYYYNDTWNDDGWDAVWESATRITDKGWTAEFKIPYDCLRFPAANHTWGILCGRYMARNQEHDQWPHRPESASGLVSRFAHLTGIENILPSRQIEILPFAVSYEETEGEHPGNPDGRDFYGNAGVDLKCGLTPNMTLSATFNPDFGQVEADQTVLNLTTFETTYAEKRPFFLEGSSIFSTWFDVFYSRRIGRAPTGWLPDAADYIDRPGATTILGAAKLTGKTSGGTSIGIIEAATQRETATYLDGGGIRKEGIVEPEANYFVARVMQDVLRNSVVGLIAAAGNQDTRHPAYTGGLDWILRFRDGAYASHGQVVGSLTGPDTRGWGGFTRLAKEGGEHFLGYLEFSYRDRNLDLNRVGYLSRNSVQEASLWAQYRTNRPWWIVSRSWNGIYADLTANLDGLRQNYGCNLESNIQFTNFWSIDVGGWVDFGRTYFDWETRGGPPVPIPIGQSWNVSFNTDNRKSWEINPYFGAGETWDGKFYSSRLWVNLRPRSNVELSVGPGYRQEWDVSRWLKPAEDGDGNRMDIFGEQHLCQFDMTLRGTLTFTRDLTLQVYAQPFMVGVDYNNFKRLLSDGTYQAVDETVYNEAVEQPDFNWNSFNSNVVVRWEYVPGSTLYLVWAQVREYTDTLGDFKFDRDLRDLFDTVPGNTFLAKVNYRFSM
jgi:hypothetical protein